MTGIASAAKFVPQRGEKRLGRTAPVHVVSSERSSAAAIARCSAPCRRSVRPRKSQRMISTVVEDSRRQLEPARKRDEAERRQDRDEEEEALTEPATPRPRTSGVIEAASCIRPRRSGIRTAAERRLGISPSCNSPVSVANAQ